FFLRPTGLIGGDSAYYLYTTAVTLDEETLPPILDRNILIVGPVILRSLTQLRVESSIEWTVIQIYLLSGLAFYVLSIKWFSWKWTTLGVFLLLISRSTLRLSW